MYEKETYDDILERMLNRTPETMDTRESSFLYNAIAPVAIELQNMYIALENIRNITFFDTADREGKYQRCKERGIDTTQFDATCSICVLEITPEDVNVPVGTRFNYNAINFVVTDKVNNGEYYVRCEEPGIGGNVIGDVSPVDYIAGLMTAKITSIYRYGEDEADEEEIDKIYYASLNSQAFGGNKADYLEKMKKIAGVGGVKVYTAAEWMGGGTVKLVFSTSANTKPSASFVSDIQNMIDPVTNQGAGYGIAPIGHTVTVVGVDVTTVDILFDVVLQEGYVWEDIKGYVEQTIDTYFERLNSEWDSVDNIIVRVSQIETRILEIPGVIDVSNVSINGKHSNLTVDNNSIIVRGSVNAET